jgi:hypothetical protein
MVPLLHESYARSMTSHGYGHGFYEPESAEDVRPGLCGYIDDSGRFQTIVDLADKTAVAENGYSAIVTPDRMLTTSRRWGPKESSSVKKRETRFEAGASGAIAGVPADASMLLTYSHSSDFGAVLLCPGDILNEGYRQKSPFRKWASENAKNILECCPDVKQHGLFVVTSTWLTTDVSTTAWRDPSKQINIGVKIGVPGIGKLGPSYEYYRAQSSGSWIDADVSIDTSRRTEESGKALT